MKNQTIPQDRKVEIKFKSQPTQQQAITLEEIAYRLLLRKLNR